MTIHTLIERLETLRAELDPKLLNMAQYGEVGWARRPLQSLIERAREEAETQSLETAMAERTASLLAMNPSPAARGAVHGPSEAA